MQNLNIHIHIPPSSALTRNLGREVDGYGGNVIVGRVVLVELRHQQIVVLHPQRELLHICG